MNEHDFHMPQPSFWPLVLAFSIMLIAIGILSTLIISAIGIILLLVAIFGWTFENRADNPQEHSDE
jgi:cytochrome c oxidase subunit 1